MIRRKLLYHHHLKVHGTNGQIMLDIALSSVQNDEQLTHWDCADLKIIDYQVVATYGTC